MISYLAKQTNGAVGLLSRDIVTRASYYEGAMLFALIPFKNPELYRGDTIINEEL